MDIVKVLRERKAKALAVEAPSDDHFKICRNDACFPAQLPVLKESFLLEDFTDYRISGVLEMYYVPDVISLLDEVAVLQFIELEEKEKWVQLKTRRLQCYGGLPPSPAPTVTPATTSCTVLPAWLTSIISSLHFLFPPSCPPNHVLVNEYTAAQGIMHHTDGPTYYHCAVIISLLSPAIMSFRRRNCSSNEFSMLLAPRSMLVFRDDIYSNYMHGIAATDVEDLSQHTILNKHMLNDIVLGEDQVKICNLFVAAHMRQLLHRDRRVSLTIRHLYRDGSSTCRNSEDST